MFVSWFKNQRNATIVMYGIASSIIVFNLITVLLFSITILSSRPDEVRRFLVSSGIFVQQESFEAILDSLYQASSIAMFVAMWFATAVLLHNYTRKLGKVRYWILVALPLVYFLSQFISNILNISIILTPDPVLRGIILTSIFTISLVVGGIMFGTAFIRLSSKFYKDNAMRNYLVIAGYGFMFLLISNNGVLVATVPYPPYGILSVSFIGVASYSILLGIYSSAVAASNDLALRKSIRKSALGEGRLLDSIGVAEAQKIMEDRASQLWFENQKFMTNEVGFATLTKEEVKTQVEEIMKELVEIRSRRNKHP
jgi:DNA-directed RNA polymerase subunit F